MKALPRSLTTLFLVVAGMASSQEKGDIIRIDTKLLNVREGPSTQHDVAGRITQNTLMLVEERKGGWVRLSDPLDRGFAEGWVNARFLVVVRRLDDKNVSTPTTPSTRFIPSTDPFSIVDADFECSESYLSDGGFDECELEVVVEINIPSIYAPYIRDYVDVTCEAQVSYRTDGSYFEHSERESESTSVYLYSNSISETLELDFDFGFNVDPVVSAKVDSLECSPD